MPAMWPGAGWRTWPNCPASPAICCGTGSLSACRTANRRWAIRSTAARARGGRYNCVWYRPADPAQDLPRLLTGVDGRQYSSAVPPDRLHPDVLARMRADATSLLAPPFAEVMTKTRQPLLQAIVDLETPAMIVGRVALVGDAAFVARPHVGMGTTKAAGDARALADHLARHDDIDTALAAYGTERLAYGQRVVRRGRHLGAYMQAQIASEEEQRQAQHFRKPEVVMTETASMHGLENW